MATPIAPRTEKRNSGDDTELGSWLVLGTM
jgi:hypothetical protein